MIYHNIAQNTDEWLALKRGKFSASIFKDLFSKETTQAYQDAIYKVAFERITGTTPETYSNSWMERGHLLEPEARELYELETYNKVHNGGFFELNEWIGVSPDGLIDSDGLIEIKSVKYSTQMRYLLENKLPSEYKWQVHGQLWVTDRKWNDFVSYCPGLPLFILRIEKDLELEKQLEVQVSEAIKKAKEIIKILEAKNVR